MINYHHSSGQLKRGLFPSATGTPVWAGSGTRATFKKDRDLLSDAVDQWSPSHRLQSTGQSWQSSLSIPVTLWIYWLWFLHRPAVCWLCVLHTYSVSAAGRGAAGKSTAFPSIQGWLCSDHQNTAVWRRAYSSLSITVIVKLIAEAEDARLHTV